ncbi:hypothetical protein HK099_008470 [Clydaea vesicula]|uniref:Mitochondrial carrier protein n=1 Tax=Clydaea vesicula TaxID=447962 RepID=A0AAD5XWW4_9FUNG|nr:hypothetical protein HK099_008470 [Clydaea vesicula]KAJ3379138.1 hypothetical protein HDU92_006898 [Lobulomyces angularis]
MVHVSSKHSKDSGTARILGSGIAGFLELGLFHPVDTVAKRLMTNKLPIGSEPGKTTLSAIIFKDAAQKGTLLKYKSLFPGFGFAAGYKILQRIYKFGGQPIMNDFLNKNYGDCFNSVFNEKHSKMMIHATAGSLIGIGEIALLPLDLLKIKMQTNPEYLKDRTFLNILRQEGAGLYKGAGWTAARNAPGSFALFGGSAVTKEKIFHLEDYSKATFLQNFTASVAGAVANVVKTRIQSAKFDSTEGGFSIVAKMIKNEGLGSFFKGLTPKLLIVGPKLIFSFTVAQQLIPMFSRWGI